ELEAVRQRRLEIAVERRFEQMASERGVALEALARKHLFHERLRRAVVLVADADADRRQIADEEVDPVIGRYDDEQVGPARLEAAPDLVEAGGQPVPVISRHRLPVSIAASPGDFSLVAARPSFGARAYFSRFAASSTMLRSACFLTSGADLTKPRSRVMSTLFCSATRSGNMFGSW